VIQLPHDQLPPPFAQWLASVETLGRYRFTEVATERRFDRDCILARGPRRGFLGQPAPDESLELRLDASSGLVLERKVRTGGDEATSFVVDRLTFDGPIEDSRFEAPPEPTGRDIPPPRAVVMARASADSTGGGAGDADGLEDQVARGTPADPAAAEAAIRHAVGHLFELSTDGQDAIHVEGGAGLGLTVRHARDRFPDVEVSWETSAVRFLTPDDAAVIFQVLPFGLQQEGRARLVGGTWADRAAHRDQAAPPGRRESATPAARREHPLAPPEQRRLRPRRACPRQQSRRQR
jgi:hypothetical protein